MGSNYSPGVDLISAERKRQIEEEGYDFYHDSSLEPRTLTRAAIAYLMADRERAHLGDDVTPWTWPFAIEDFHPSPEDRKKELIKAAALIAAELDRLIIAEQGDVGGYF